MMLSDKKFLPLREMESFTEDMFNRIIAFQEKQHNAWNSALTFEQRINGLPLHYLVFSNPDRDPNTTGPTVAHYYPLREEIQKLAHYILQINEKATVTDMYPGNGFIGSLLAREGMQVTGLRKNILQPNQIPELYDQNCYQFSDGDLADNPGDAVLVSWPTAGQNPTPELIKHNTKAIVYIYTDHENKSTNRPQTGHKQMFDGLEENYQLADQWSITRPENLLHEIWPDMTTNIAETRHVQIYLTKAIDTITPFTPDTSSKPYDWEKDLSMAQLALEAKQLIQSTGMKV